MSTEAVYCPAMSERDEAAFKRYQEAGAEHDRLADALREQRRQLGFLAAEVGPYRTGDRVRLLHGGGHAKAGQEGQVIGTRAILGIWEKGPVFVVALVRSDGTPGTRKVERYADSLEGVQP